VPYVDALLLASDAEDRIAINIGGIANLTIVPRRSAPQDVVAFDSGPGNMLIDAFVQRRTRGSQTFDRDGKLALAGTVQPAALATMLNDPYFSLAAPKSTGRERFGAQFLDKHVELQGLSLEDGVATLTALTAAALAQAVTAAGVPRARILVSGGGVDNPAIMRELRQRLPEHRVERSDTMNLPADSKEAVAFAILGYETLRGRAANVPRSTGAGAQVVLGAIAPHDVTNLLEKVRVECRG
jgi:anhydro-N-acetylmuramic acid kinase